MGKSRAEIQKAYRQRLKEKNNADYLMKERERMRQNYVPSATLSENDRKRRNSKNRENLRRFYQRRREARSPHVSLGNATSSYESEQPSSSNEMERGRLRVKLSFPKKRKGALKRWKRDLSDAHSRIRLLEQERDELIKKCRTTQRAIQRHRQKQPPIKLTPKKETEKLMRDASLSDTQREKVRRPLLLGNAIANEIKESKEKACRRQLKIIHRTVSGKIVKKYKLSKLLGKKIGLCRHRLAKVDSKSGKDLRMTRKNTVEKLRKDIVEFMTREDNSRMQPGKQDAKKIKKGQKVQTYILSDYLSNLYAKFISENTTAKISFASFCRARPKHVLISAYSRRSSCLCTKHQNAALTIKSLRKIGFDIQANPEKVVKQMPAPEQIKNAIGDSICVSQWKRTEVEERGKKKYVTKLVERQLGKEEFEGHFQDQMNDFSGHVDRVHAQYEQIRLLKEKLPEHELILQLDFAENYSCKSLDEVQSAYFNQTAVTLHPMEPTSG